MAGTWTPHAPLHAFYLVCGELDGGVAEERAWIACMCGAV